MTTKMSISPMGLMNQDKLIDFLDNKALLKNICNEYNCDEFENIYTKEQAEYMSDTYEEYETLKEEANKEVYENY